MCRIRRRIGIWRKPDEMVLLMDVFSKERKVYLEDKGAYFKIIMNDYPKRNIFSYEFGKDFVEVLTRVHQGSKNVCVITGVKDCFCAGADLKIITKSGISIKNYLSEVIRQLNKIEKSDKIFISAVNGHALGGGLETALATDIIIASDKAVFGLPEIRLGLIPGADGIKRIVKALNKQRAMWLLLTGEILEAVSAKELGIINDVVPRKKLEKRADQLAKEIANRSPIAISSIKKLVRLADKKDISNLETKAFGRCLRSRDTLDLIKRFLNK